jgi:hypothetical protein
LRYTGPHFDTVCEGVWRHRGPYSCTRADAREPERRKVSIDARVAVGGVTYQVDPNLAGETVVLWWGLFDQDLYVEHGAHRYGPYQALGGPIPLHRYRRFKKTMTEQRAEHIEVLATQLVLPRTALTGLPPEAPHTAMAGPALQPFVDPDPFQEFTYPTRVAAKLAIADSVALPLAKLASEPLDAIASLLSQTLRKHDVLVYVRTQIQPTLRRSPPCSGM